MIESVRASAQGIIAWMLPYVGISICFGYIGSSLAGTDLDLAVSYEVVCEEGKTCKVDKFTYKGWRAYHSTCHVCHAQDAVGSTFAPSLLVRLKDMEKARFEDVVRNGYTGQVGVMPGWKDNPNVLPQLDNLWNYLKARADGVLASGKPGKL